VANRFAFRDVIPGRNRNQAKSGKHVEAFDFHKVFFRETARSTVENARTCRKITACRAAEVRAEAETARRAESNFIVRRVSESVSRSLCRTVSPANEWSWSAVTL
jgi:hypothetical protein